MAIGAQRLCQAFQIRDREAAGGTVRLDEYEEEYHLPITRSIEPLTLGELIRLLDETENPFNDAGGGLVRNHWLRNQDYMDPEEAVDFVSITSAFYPDLTEYFENEAACWLREQCDRLEEMG